MPISDWSSDVCSSDLMEAVIRALIHIALVTSGWLSAISSNWLRPTSATLIGVSAVTPWSARCGRKQKGSHRSPGSSRLTIWRRPASSILYWAAHPPSRRKLEVRDRKRGGEGKGGEERGE